METIAQLASGTKVRVVGGHYFGQTGTVKHALSNAELKDTYYSHYDFAYVVEIRLWPPMVETGEGIVLMEEFSEEALARAKASGRPYQVDSGLREMLFATDQIKLCGDEPFWHLYEERKCAHAGNARHRANRACNLWRRHMEGQAVETARGCHPMNLLLSALDQPPNFKRHTRLDLEGWVELCRAAGKNERLTTDILFHMYFESREPEEIANLMPRCTCTEN